MIKIPTDERNVTDEQVLEAFNSSFPGLENVRDAIHKKDYETAKRELVSYFHTRDHVSYFFDYRGLPLKPVEGNADHRFLQAGGGVGETFEDFIVRAGESLMKHSYVIPGGRAEPMDLGPRFETAPHFNCLTDEGKRSRTPTNIFTRGQWMEYLFIRYQNTGDHRVAEKFVELFHYFINDYALLIEDTGVNAARFQYTEDRTVMSVGFLCQTYIELLYTEMAYAVGYEVTFEIIKHMWFIGIQFSRFRNDTYRPYNHHLWERGVMFFLLGTMFPEIPAFADMKAKGAEQVNLHAKDDFNAQGGYSEYSIAYWSGATLSSMLFKSVHLAKLNGEILLDCEAVERIDKTFGALAQIAPPTEHYPLIGDGGAGALTNRVLALGEKMADHRWCRELLQYRTGVSTELPSMPLYYSNDSVGFTCGRTGFDQHATYFLMATRIDCGVAGHNHMDMLSLNIIVRGESFIGEPYTGRLYPRVRMGSKQRGYLYNMTSHNTVLAYGKPIAEDAMYARQWGVFRPESPVLAFETSPDGMYAEASHSGYSYCRHVRKVLFANNGNMLVRDEIRPGSRINEPHVQRWHLMPGILCQKIGETALLLEKNGIRLLGVWHGIEEIILWKDDAVLCPEMYPSKDSLGYNIDIKFRGDSSSDVEGLTVTMNMAWIDVTDQEDYDVSKILDLLGSVKSEICLNEILKQLKNI